MATAGLNYYCHKCESHIGPVSNFQCPRCEESFIEEAEVASTPTPPRNVRNNNRYEMQGNTTVFFGGGHPLQTNVNRNEDFGSLLQTVLTQMTGGMTGAGPQFPFLMHNGTGGGVVDPTNLDAFLTQFLNQMGGNNGPAPATETRINSIPTVKISGDQIHENLQCAICMEDFKENDQAKRLPCSHHFHEQCILRWLRLHGTCPTCRVTLNNDNSINQQTSRNTTNRENNGSQSSSQAGQFNLDEFD